MIAVDYPRLRMRGQVDEMPAEGLVLVNWDRGGSTRIPVDELKRVALPPEFDEVETS